MPKHAYHILRVGMAITFLWIGLLIFQNPEAWGGYIQPWMQDLIPIGVAEFMIGVAIFDLVVGFFLLIDTFTWAFALLGALHLVGVLTVSGISPVTVRDIAILAGCISLFFDAPNPILPMSAKKHIVKKPPKA